MTSKFRGNQKAFLCNPIALLVAFAVLIVFSAAGGVVRPVSAQTAHETIAPSLVYLKAEGRGPSDPQAKEAYGTGFLVSQDGLVLTTYHLISELGKDVVPSTVKFWASVGRMSANMERVTVVDAAITTDLLLLKMPPVARFQPVKIGRAFDHRDEQPIYTSGFPKSTGPVHVKGQGIVKQRDGEGSYTWTTDLGFEYSQSGSPIYNAAGEVIGIAKGDNSRTLAYFIPIEFSSSLLAQVHFRAIQKAFEDYEALRSKLEWSGSYKQHTGLILLQYEKFVAGKPHVATIDIVVEAVGLKSNKYRKMDDFKVLNKEPSANIGEIGRTFEFPDVWGEVEGLRTKFGYEVINSLEITIIARMSDRTEQPAKRITIDVRK